MRKRNYRATIIIEPLLPNLTSLNKGIKQNGFATVKGMCQENTSVYLKTQCSLSDQPEDLYSANLAVEEASKSLQSTESIEALISKEDAQNNNAGEPEEDSRPSPHGKPAGQAEVPTPTNAINGERLVSEGQSSQDLIYMEGAEAEEKGTEHSATDERMDVEAASPIHTTSGEDFSFTEKQNVESSLSTPSRKKPKVDPRHVKQFLCYGTYPNESTVMYRRSIRRTVERNYKLEDSKVWYRKFKVRGTSNEVYLWREVIIEAEQQLDVIKRMHVFKGEHQSRKATQVRVEDSYYWPNILHDVNHFVDHCEKCSLQQANKSPCQKKLVDVRWKNGYLQNATETGAGTKDYLLCSMCGFGTHSRKDYLDHKYNFHVWKCKCGFSEKNGDLAALHLTKCRETFVFTDITRPLHQNAGKDYKRRSKEKPNKLEKSRKKEVTCGKCAGCKVQKNCGKCKFCQALTTNGKVTTKQGCLKRRCVKPRVQLKRSPSNRSSRSSESEAERNYQRQIEREAADILGLMESMESQNLSSEAHSDHELFLDNHLIDSFTSQLDHSGSRDPIGEAAEQLIQLQESSLDCIDAVPQPPAAVTSAATGSCATDGPCVPSQHTGQRVASGQSKRGSAGSRVKNRAGGSDRASQIGCCLSCISGVPLVFSQADIQSLKEVASKMPTVEELSEWFQNLS